MSRKPTYKELEQRVRKLTNELLERDQMEKELERIFNFSIDMIGSGNLQGYFTKINSSFGKTLGYSEKEILEHPFIKFVHDDDVEKTKQALVDAAKGKKEIFIENRYKCKDGSYKWLEWKVSVIIKENKFIAVGRDITGRKQAEGSLLKSEEKYRRLFESLVDVFYQADNSGKITMVSPSITKAAGYEPEEVIGSYLTNYYVNPDERNKFLKLISTNGFVENFEVQMKKKDGSVLWASVNATLSKDQEGNVVGVEGIARDITRRKEVKKELLEFQDELENSVKKRTRELEIQKKNLEEANTAFQVLLDKRKEDKKEIENSVLTNVKEMIVPYIEKLKKTKLDDQQKALLNIVETNLNEIISPFVRKVSLKYLNLTPIEIHIANLIRHGLNSKDISELMGVSPQTIYNHRKNIRKKLELEKKQTNLRSHLLSTY